MRNCIQFEVGSLKVSSNEHHYVRYISVCDLCIPNKKKHAVSLWNSSSFIPSVAVVWLRYVV
jgi:hypothetical protein